IYTPAIPADNEEWERIRSLGVPVKKRAVVLGEISRNYKTIAVAGTHGKTSTASMIAFLLNKSDVQCNAFLGGISKNIDSNFIYNKNAEFCVVEADEYDRSFLQLHPNYSIITSVDDDHLDIYKTSDEVKSTYSKFANQTKTLVIAKKGIEDILKVDNVCTYSLYKGEAVLCKGDAIAQNIKVENGAYIFDYIYGDTVITDLTLNGCGEYGVENAVAAITATLKVGVKPEDIKRSLPFFTGVLRRFDFQVKTPDIIYVDDYAHHPKEIETSINALKKLYPEHLLLVVFQPHLYSRTRDFADGFASSLSLADELVLLDIYPARELPIDGITSKTIGNNISDIPLKYETKETVLVYLKIYLKKYLKECLSNETRKTLLVTMGAGDIDTLVDPIITIILISLYNEFAATRAAAATSL
ncbi:MAG: UDP-N-acetylmuramate--L-alanine ligase, partial [Bacteroidales bacterium]|nr:UDP-N-acetylmuramate--L-alanine ligase [Bacteroidales bacterium]